MRDFTAYPEELSFHNPRHTAIPHLIKFSTADIHTIARFAGHAKPSMTLDKYAREFEGGTQLRMQP